MIRHFRNEVGHDVTVEVDKKEVAGVECIDIAMAGPDSDTEWEITKVEAQVLYEMLGKALGWKK